MRTTSTTGAAASRAIAIGAIAALVSVLSHGTVEAAPQVQVKERTIDLGTVAPGDPVEARFELENVGDAPLRILGADPGCRCSLVSYDEVIPPGSVGQVTVSLDTTQLRGASIKNTIVRVNDPQKPSVILRVKSNVVGRVKLLPDSVIFMRQRGDDPPVARCLVRQEPNTRGTLRVSHLTSTDERFVATASRLDRPTPGGEGLPPGMPGDWLLEVHFRDNLPLFGKIAGKVLFRTALPDEPQVVVDVESNLQGVLSLSTSKLELLPAAGGGAHGTVFASVREGVDATELRAVADPPELEVAVQATTERLYKISVRWAGGRLSEAAVDFHLAGQTVRMPVELAGP